MAPISTDAHSRWITDNGDYMVEVHSDKLRGEYLLVLKWSSIQKAWAYQDKVWPIYGVPKKMIEVDLTTQLSRHFDPGTLVQIDGPNDDWESDAMKASYLYI